MFGNGFELSTILRTGPDGLTRLITRSSWDDANRSSSSRTRPSSSSFADGRTFHEKALGFRPSWGSHAC